MSNKKEKEEILFTMEGEDAILALQEFLEEATGRIKLHVKGSLAWDGKEPDIYGKIRLVLELNGTRVELPPHFFGQEMWEALEDAAKSEILRVSKSECEEIRACMLRGHC